MSEVTSARLKHTYPVKGSDDREAQIEIIWPGNVHALLGLNRRTRKSAAPKAAPSLDNPILNDDAPDQCVHIHDDGVRCGCKVLLGSHGFNCASHQRRPSIANIDMQIVRDVLRTEREAIAAGVRTKVRISKHVTLNFLS